MGRLARAAIVGVSTRRFCDVHAYPPAEYCPHVARGKILNGSSNVFIEGIPAVHEGCIEDCQCNHGGFGRVSDGSGSVEINGHAAARVKDSTSCYLCFQEGSIVDGAVTVFIGD